MPSFPSAPSLSGLGFFRCPRDVLGGADVPRLVPPWGRASAARQPSRILCCNETNEQQAPGTDAPAYRAPVALIPRAQTTQTQDPHDRHPPLVTQYSTSLKEQSAGIQPDAPRGPIEHSTSTHDDTATSHTGQSAHPPQPPRDDPTTKRSAIRAKKYQRARGRGIQGESGRREGPDSRRPVHAPAQQTMPACCPATRERPLGR